MRCLCIGPRKQSQLRTELGQDVRCQPLFCLEDELRIAFQTILNTVFTSLSFPLCLLPCQKPQGVTHPVSQMAVWLRELPHTPTSLSGSRPLTQSPPSVTAW